LKDGYKIKTGRSLRCEEAEEEKKESEEVAVVLS
jgi:hypothetical protein